MMEEKDISERNKCLIDLVRAVDMGLHIVDLPHKPKILSADYKYWLSGYVHNFHLFLNTEPKPETNKHLHDFKLRPIENMDIESIRVAFTDWMSPQYEHMRVYTISEVNSGMFLTGFDHHNRLKKSSPYPVFARFNPHLFYTEQKAQDIVKAFKMFDLVIN